MTRKNSPQSTQNRQKIIVRTSFLGILTNFILVIFKMLVGLLSGSLAIVFDAINNATDVLSSVVAIVGTKLASRQPDREHPHGHGRFEYLAAMVIGLIIFFTGVMALIESAPKIFHSALADYSWVSFCIIAAAVVTKLLLGHYVKRVGRRVDSSSLVASGLDAQFDAALSFSTLIGIIVNMLCGVSIDGLLSTIIAVFIIYSSINILSEATLDLLGGQIDGDLAHKIRTLATSFPEVSGAYDLTIHNYGPSTLIGSMQIEVPDDMTAKSIHQLTRKISRQVFQKYGVILTIGIYAAHNLLPEHQIIRERLDALVVAQPAVSQMHGFYVDEELGIVAFELVVESQARDKSQIKQRIIRAMRKSFPQYRFLVTLDVDTTR